MTTAKIPIFDLITCMSETMDFINPAIVNHHKQVAYLSYVIGKELGLPSMELNELVLAAEFHDVGSFSIRERTELLNFEYDRAQQHCELGYLFLRMFRPFANAANIVRYHHANYGKTGGDQSIPLNSHILHLADRVAVLIDHHEEVLGQSKDIIARIESQSGKMFMPRLVDAFKNAFVPESVWLDAVYPSVNLVLKRALDLGALELDMDDFLSMAKMFSYIIDFRSRFTATHSSGVQVCAEELSRLAGFPEMECRMMKMAGYLHDLGKLAIPSEILEKPSGLTREEYSIIRSHTFYTYRILENIDALKTVNTWAAFHHESLDGKGYPFHIKGAGLPTGSRIMAVADVFVALTENRPYRQGMEEQRTMSVINQMGANQVLDQSLLTLLQRNYGHIDSLRIKAQEEAEKEYEGFMSACIPK